MKHDRATGILLITLGTLTVGTGLFLIVARPAMLPEDVRFAGIAASALGPDMERWLRIVFRTWGGFMSGFGLLLGGVGGFVLTGRQAWLRAGVCAGTTVAFALFVASNVTLHSDFLWFVALLGTLALGTSARIALSREEPAFDRTAGRCPKHGESSESEP